MLSTIFPPRAFDDHVLVERRVPVHVLVVDDVVARRGEIAGVLRGEGFDVIEASSGAEGLAVAARATLDAVVLDLALSDHDAFDLCRRLKRDAAGFLPILQLSMASASSDAWIRGLDAGVDGHLTHPFDSNELRGAVHALVRLKRHDAERIAQATATSLLEEALDALPDHIALLGPTGDLLAVNRAWAAFAHDNEYAASGAGLGVNYCDVCARDRARLRRGAYRPGGDPLRAGWGEHGVRAGVRVPFAHHGALVPDVRATGRSAGRGRGDRDPYRSYPRAARGPRRSGRASQGGTGAPGSCRR
jgi:CheY-like chemotaxis protein